ncbi:AMP-binding protein [Streptomyces sp. NPDC004629]|uniref:AMP-binding protein n=1 Tax=Streptomyces sp. NPDC004629 TaxID=3364705 RepID=UPI0036C3C9C9
MTASSTDHRSTLPQLLAEVVARTPGAPAVIDDTPDALTTTYGQLWRRVVSLRDDLRERGVGEGDCVAVYLPNWGDAIVWQFAVAALGAHVVGINTRYAIGDIAHIVEQARPVVVAVAHAFRGLPFRDRLREGVRQAGVPAPSTAVITAPDQPPASSDAVAGYDLGAGAWPPREADLSAPLDPHALDGAPDALAVAFATSGSTGRPKLAAHLSSNVVHHARAVAAAAGLGPESRSLMPLPLSGVLAFSPAYACLAGGGALVMQPSFDGPHALALMERHGVTHLTSADDIGGRIKAAWEREPRNLSAFRRFLFGDFYGQSADIARWFEQRTDCTAMGIYGSSEVFGLLTFWRPADDAPGRWAGGGRPPSPEAELRIVDPVSGQPLPTGQSGELQVRGYAVVDAYLGDSDGSVMAGNRSTDGWFRTGDLCHMCEDGSVVYQCRMGDSLRLKGFLVEPVEIESVIAQLPEVEMVKVVGLGGEGEMRPICFVVARAGSTVDADAVRRYCVEQLARYKVPEVVHVIDEMPTTRGANGTKIRAAALRELAAELDKAPTKGKK